MILSKILQSRIFLFALGLAGFYPLIISWILSMGSEYNSTFTDGLPTAIFITPFLFIPFALSFSNKTGRSIFFKRLFKLFLFNIALVALCTFILITLLDGWGIAFGYFIALGAAMISPIIMFIMVFKAISNHPAQKTRQ